MRPTRLIPRLASLSPALWLSLVLVWAGASAAEAAGAEPAKPPATVANLVVYLHQSATVDAPWDVKRVSITDPQIADVQVLTPRQVLVQGKSVGATSLILWSEDEQAMQVRVDVNADLSHMTAELKKVFPLADLNLVQSAGVILVRGSLARAEEVAELNRYLDALGTKYVNMTSLAGAQQVLIQVRVAEVSRTALRTLGINAFQAGRSFFGASTIGASGGPINPISIGPLKGTLATNNIPFKFTADAAVSPSVTLFGGFPKAGIEVFIQALAENQYLRILAEPNLVALSGEEASFLAGGEFPIPVAQGSSAGGGSSITVEYKEFGIRLRFKPTVLGDSTIRLHVAPEVSELSDIGAVEIQGFRIPSLVSRKAETTLELRSGQTFAMAGLLSRSTDARNSRVPLLGDMPIIGPLFRSVRYNHGETELVVLVTASLVEPLSLTTKPPVPGTLHVMPDDWELYTEGRLEGKSPPKLSRADAAWLKKLGFGSLKGPGPWESSDQGPARSRATARPAPPAPAKPSATAAPAPAKPPATPAPAPAPVTTRPSGQ